MNEHFLLSSKYYLYKKHFKTSVGSQLMQLYIHATSVVIDISMPRSSKGF